MFFMCVHLPVSIGPIVHAVNGLFGIRTVVNRFFTALVEQQNRKPNNNDTRGKANRTKTVTETCPIPKLKHSHTLGHNTTHSHIYMSTFTNTDINTARHSKHAHSTHSITQKLLPVAAQARLEDWRITFSIALRRQ